MVTEKARLTTSVFFLLSPLVLVWLLLLVKEYEPGSYRFLVREDSWVEYLTFFSYLLAFILASGIAAGCRKRGQRGLAVIHALLAFVFLVFAGEEISWGQRLLGIQPPEFFARHSFQYEMNFHNLRAVKAFDNFFQAKVFVAIGTYGGLAWLLLWLWQRITGQRVTDLRLHCVVPPWTLCGFFLLTALYFYYRAYLFPQHMFYNVRLREQEVMELVLGLGALLMMCRNQRMISRSNST